MAENPAHIPPRRAVLPPPRTHSQYGAPPQQHLHPHAPHQLHLHPAAGQGQLHPHGLQALQTHPAQLAPQHYAQHPQQFQQQQFPPQPPHFQQHAALAPNGGPHSPPRVSPLMGHFPASPQSAHGAQLPAHAFGHQQPAFYQAQFVQQAPAYQQFQQPQAFQLTPQQQQPQQPQPQQYAGGAYYGDYHQQLQLQQQHQLQQHQLQQHQHQQHQQLDRRASMLTISGSGANRTVPIPARVASAAIIPERSASAATAGHRASVMPGSRSPAAAAAQSRAGILKRNFTESGFGFSHGPGQQQQHHLQHHASIGSSGSGSGLDPVTAGSFGAGAVDFGDAEPGALPSRGTTHVHIPSRGASKQKTTIDDLLSSGAAALAPPKSDLREALRKWAEALAIADREFDMLRKAKAQSNIGCALRSAGHVVAAKQYLEESWASTLDYIKSASSRFPSNWLQIAIRALDLEGDQLDDAFVTSSEMSRAHRPPSIRSISSDASLGATAAAAASQQNEAALGPPIVVWLMQLTNNLGNAYFSVGDYEAAILQYENCKRLVETTLEEYPLPEDLVAAIHSASSSAATATAADAASNNPRSTPAPPTKQFRLSYLHRQALIAQARSLTHLGAAFGALGFSASSIQHHRAAHALLTTVAASIPAMSSAAHFARARTTSMTRPNTGLAETTMLQAAVVSNIGSAWHAVGEFGKAVEWHEKGVAMFSTVWAHSLHHSQSQSRMSDYQQPPPTPPSGGDASSVSSASLYVGDISLNHVVTTDEARQQANLAMMYIELGRSINEFEWLHLVRAPSTSSGAGRRASVADATQDTSGNRWALERIPKFWRGPPNELDEPLAAPEPASLLGCTEPLFDRGFGLMYEQASLFRQQRDWQGLYTAWTNLACAYLQIHRPIMAAHYLGLLAGANAADNKPIDTAALSQSFDEELPQPLVPKSMHPAVIATLAQCMFALSRFSTAASPFMTSTQAARAGPGGSLDASTVQLPLMIPATTTTAVARLAEQLGVAPVDLKSPSEEMAILVLRRAEAALVELAQIRASPALLPILSNAATMLANNASGSGLGGRPDSQMGLAQSASASSAMSAAHVDNLKKRMLSVHITIAKTAWVLSASYPNTEKDIRQMWFSEAKLALEQAMSGSVVDGVPGGDVVRRMFGMDGPDRPDSRNSNNGGTGLTGVNLVQGVLADLLMQVGDHIETTREQPVEVGRPLVSGFVPPVVFANIVDLLYFAQFVSAHTPSMAGMMEMLGTTEANVSTIINAFSASAISLYCTQMGLCLRCIKHILKALRGSMSSSASSGLLQAQPPSPTLSTAAAASAAGKFSAASAPGTYPFSIVFRHHGAVAVAAAVAAAAASGADDSTAAAASAIGPHTVVPCEHMAQAAV
ncbi:hypothetical protein HK105_205969 [Polyrhizophydium stewartii]|uniref:Uncharacterized protein n=1 Tax=Polyrhizophydium stewartii TaxID=2732419 RepID=A0ABR4N4E6_9FUNG